MSKTNNSNGKTEAGPVNGEQKSDPMFEIAKRLLKERGINVEVEYTDENNWMIYERKIDPQKRCNELIKSIANWD